MDDRTDPNPDLATAAQVQSLLDLAAFTYRAATEQRRRMAAVAATISALFGILALFGAWQWFDTRQEIADVVDEPLVEVVGIEIPDPRPAVERAALRLRATVYAAGAVVAGFMAAVIAGVWLLVRPSRVPAELEWLVRTRRSPDV